MDASLCDLLVALGSVFSEAERLGDLDMSFELLPKDAEKLFACLRLSARVELTQPRLRTPDLCERPLRGKTVFHLVGLSKRGEVAVRKKLARKRSARP
jgi:hypothetical protein